MKLYKNCRMNYIKKRQSIYKWTSLLYNNYNFDNNLKIKKEFSDFIIESHFSL